MKHWKWKDIRNGRYFQDRNGTIWKSSEQNNRLMMAYHSGVFPRIEAYGHHKAISMFSLTRYYTEVKNPLETTFFKRERRYKSAVGESAFIHEILPEELTINLKGARNMYCGYQKTYNTMFDEIQLMPPDSIWDVGDKLIAEEKIVKKKIPAEEFYQRVFDVYKHGIEFAWNPKLFHVIHHSSGYDSRLTSLALRDLRAKHGDDWIGNILFLEYNTETDGFNEVMDILGWEKDKRIIYNASVHPTETHAWSIEHFDGAWKRLNCGTIGYPINTNYDCFEWLMEQDIIPCNSNAIQSITGHGGSELARYMYQGATVKEYLRGMYRYAFTGFPLKIPNRIHPYHNHNLMRTVCKWGDGHFKQESLSHPIGDYIEPKLKHVTRVDTPELKQRGGREISKRLAQIAQEDYYSSQFYKDYNIEVSPTSRLDYCYFWGYWNLASFYQHLTEAGININRRRK